MCKQNGNEIIPLMQTLHEVDITIIVIINESMHLHPISSYPSLLLLHVL